MQWTNQQAAALTSVSQWLKSRSSPWFYLAGYAGTGKTTLAKHLSEDTGWPVFGAYTGKAAQVLRSKGCTGATTVHRLIYKPEKGDTPALIESQLEAIRRRAIETANSGNLELARRLDGVGDKLEKKLEKAKKKQAKKKADDPEFTLREGDALSHATLVVLDECSMVDEQMGRDLLSFNVPILVLGDPEQLEPVNGPGFFTGKQPDFLLTDVCRQAKDNPVLHMATKVRNKERLMRGSYGDSEVIGSIQFDTDRKLLADIVLVGKNATRRGVNTEIRKALEMESKYPLAGDRMICLTNDHEKQVFNGSTFVATTKADRFGEDLALEVYAEDDCRHMQIHTNRPNYDGSEDDRTFWQRRNAGVLETDYAYALTVHKAQGSQWDYVAIDDESFVSRRTPDGPRRWLYTAITRAAKRVTISV
jgi:exodeoxyribonuclease-5